MSTVNVLSVNVKLNADGSMLVNGIKKSREEVEAFARSSATAGNKAKEFGNYSAEMGNKVSDLGKSVAELVVSLAAVGGALHKVVEAGLEFETKISQLTVITGATGNDLDILKNKAISLGNELGRTGSAFAEAAAVMASQRPELLKMPAILAETTAQAVTLAQAANAMGIAMSDADAAKYLGGTLNQFNLDASQAARIINVFTSSAKEGAALIGDVAESMKQAGGTLSSANISVEESAGIIETLAKFNIMGSEAGVAIRNFVNILGGSADKLAALGIAADEVNPQVVGLFSALKRLEDANLSAADITYLFGMENANAAIRLIQNRSEVERFTKAVTGTNAAYDSAIAGSIPLKEQWNELSSRLTNLAVGIYEHFEPSLKSMMSTINTSFEVFTGLAVQLGIVNQSFSGVVERSTEAQAALYAFEEVKTVFGEIFIDTGILATKFFTFLDGNWVKVKYGIDSIGSSLLNVWYNGQIGVLEFALKVESVLGSIKIAFGTLVDAFVNDLKKSIDNVVTGGIGQTMRALGGPTGAIIDSLDKARDSLNQYSGAEKQARLSVQERSNAYEKSIFEIKAIQNAMNGEVQSLEILMAAQANAANQTIAALEEQKLTFKTNSEFQKTLKNTSLDIQSTNKIGIQQAQMLAQQTAVFGEEANKATTEALAYASAVQKVVFAQQKAAEINKGQSIGEGRKLLESLKNELNTVVFDNNLDKKLTELKKKIGEDLAIGDSAITKDKAKELLDLAFAQAQVNFLVEQSIDIGKEREKVFANGNLAQEFINQYNRITFLTEAQRAQLVQEKASIEVLKLKEQIHDNILKAGLSEEQTRINDLMKQYSGIISETTAKNIASIEKQAKGYGELRGAYDRLQVAGVISEQNELIQLSQKYGESIGKQIFEINNLAKARQDAVNAEKDVQLAGLTGIQREIASTAIKYGGDIDAAKQVVGLQRQKAAIEELTAAQKELANSGLTAEQQKYLDLTEKIGASAAKQAIEMRNLAEARKAGVAELQKSMEELQTTGLSERAKGYFDVIKNVAPEYRNQIIVLKQQTEEIQKQSLFYSEITSKVADQFALITTGQKTISQGWKDMANDVGSMLQKVAADRMKNQIMQLFSANNPQQDIMVAIKAAQQADAERAKQFQVTIQEVDLSVKKTIEERSIDATSKMGSTISDGVNKLQTSLENALSNLNQSIPKAIESFGKQMSDAISDIKIPSQQQMSKTQTVSFNPPVAVSSNEQKYDFSQSKNRIISKLAEIAKQQGVAAEDLIRFAKIESNFNPNAFNKSSKAAGMFQFIPSTAKAYGIRGNEFDIEANTLAAIKLWKDNEKSLRSYLGKMNGAMAYLAHQQGAGGLKDILRAARGDSFHLNSTRRNINANVAGDIEKYTGVSKKQFQQMDDSNMAKTFVDYWTKKFNAIPLDRYGVATGEATAAIKVNASAQKEQAQTILQAKTVQSEQTSTVKEASLTQAQMLDQQNAAFIESSQNALKAAENIGGLGLEAIKSSDMIASGAQLALAKIVNIADARVAAIYNMKASGASQPIIQDILNANSRGNLSGLAGVVVGSSQDQMLAEQMMDFNTSVNGFFGKLGDNLRYVVSDVKGWVEKAKSTISGWTDSLGLTGENGLFGAGNTLLGDAAQWAGTVGSLLKGDIKGAMGSAFSVGLSALGNTVLPGIGGLVGGFAANALSGLITGRGETRNGGLYSVNEKGDFKKIQGPSGGDIGGKEGFDRISEVMTGTVRQINNLLEKLGSKEKVVDFKGALETSKEGRGGVYSGGKLASGKTFGEQFNGQNVFESQTSRTLNAEQATKAFQLDLMQATLQAVQAATDVPKFVSNILKDIDIEALDEKGVNALLTTIESINAMGDAMQNLGFSTDSITQLMIESAGGIESFKTNMSIFTDKFANDQDKTFAALNNATSDLEKNLSALGGVIPQSRDSLVDMVKGLDLTSEAGQQAFGSLMKLMPALNQYYSIQENAVDKYFEVFGTAQQRAARSQEKLNEQFNKFGLKVPQSETAFQRLVEQLYAGDQASKNQAIALMNLYPQWKANLDAQNLAGSSLSVFTANLKTMASSINEQIISSNLGKAVTDAKSPQEAGDAFATAMMQSIQQTMVSTLIQSISQAVLTGLVQPMMTGASNAAMMQAQGGSIAGMNMAQGGTMAATANAHGGSIAATNVIIGGQNAANAIAMGGASAANALSAGGQSAADRVQAVIAQAREMMSTMTAVMKDKGMQAVMSEMMNGFKTIGTETYTAVGEINQLFAQFTPAANNFSNAASGAAEAVGQAAEDMKGKSKELRDWLNGQKLGTDSSATFDEKYNLALQNFNDLKAKAFANDIEAQGKLTAAADTLLRLGKEGYAHSSKFIDLERYVRASVGSVADKIDGLEPSIMAEMQPIAKPVANKMGSEIPLFSPSIVSQPIISNNPTLIQNTDIIELLKRINEQITKLREEIAKNDAKNSKEIIDALEELPATLGKPIIFAINSTRNAVRY